MEFKLLVETLLDINWLQKTSEIIDLFHQFIINLLTAKNELVSICTVKILARLIPEDDEAKELINNLPTEQYKIKINSLHVLIKRLIEVIPMLPVTLRNKIPQMFPYYKHHDFKILTYISNILEILSYCPSLMHDVLESTFE